MGGGRPGLADGALNVALVVGGLLVGVLLYGLASRAVAPPAAPVPTAAPGDTLDTGPRVRVEVFNAAGRDGLAAAATAYLRGRGFDVLRTESAAPRDTSAVVVQNGTAADGRHVAAALRLAARAVVADTAALDYDPDVQVFLGRDYRAPFPLDSD